MSNTLIFAQVREQIVVQKKRLELRERARQLREQRKFGKQTQREVLEARRKEKKQHMDALKAARKKPGMHIPFAWRNCHRRGFVKGLQFYLCPRGTACAAFWVLHALDNIFGLHLGGTEIVGRGLR